MPAAITDKDIYSGKPNPMQDVNAGLQTTIKLSQDLLKLSAELSKQSVVKINSNQKKSTDDLRAYSAEVTKLNEINQKSRLLQDQLRQSEDSTVKAKLRYNDAVRTQRKEINQLIKWQKAEKASIDKLNAANAILRNRVRGVSSATEDGRKKIALYNKAIDRNTAKVRKLSDAQTQQYKNVGNYGSALKGVGSALGIFTSGALLAAQAIRKFVSVTKDAIQVNRDFEKTFANVLTLLDEAQKKEFEDVLAVGAVDIMANYGFAIQDTNKALFDVISNGIEAGDAIGFLDKSARLAVAGNAELSDVVKGATKVYTIYKDEVESVDEIMNAFFAAQVKGATDVNLLANNIGKIASVAKFAGIGVNELFGTFAGLTKFLDGTEESATALTATITTLLKVKPGSEQERAFKDLGIEVGATAIQSNGLLETLLKVAKASETDSDQLSKLVPNIRALKGIAGLTTDTIEELKDNIEQLNDQEKSSILLQEAFNEQMATGQKQADLLGGSWDRLLITVGGGESIFKKIGSAVRSDLNKEITDLTKQLEIFKVTWSRVFGDLSKDEYGQALLDIENRFAGITKEVDKTNEALEGNEAITKKQMALIIQYNKELGTQLKFTKENFDLVDKYYKEIPPVQEKEIQTLKSLGEELKKLKEQRQEINTNDIASLVNKDAEIKKIEEQIKAIEDLIEVQSQSLSSFKSKEIGISITQEESDTSILDSVIDQNLAKIKDGNDRELQMYRDKNKLIEDIENKHYDSLIDIGANYFNKKAAQNKDLTDEELQSIVTSNEKQAAAIQELASTLINIYKEITQAKIDELQTTIDAQNQSISELQNNLNTELQLQEEGSANRVTATREELKEKQTLRDENLKEQQRLQKQQERINTLTQISALATAVANIISGYSEIPIVGVILGLAAAASAIVGFSAAKSDISSATAEDGGVFVAEKGTFIEKGNRHSKGGNQYDGLNTESGELHGVLSRGATRKYGDYVTDMMNLANADKLDMYNSSLPIINNQNIINNNYSELLQEQRHTNKILKSQTFVKLDKNGKPRFYNYLGKLKEVHV